jgi:hypothetical protein
MVILVVPKVLAAGFDSRKSLLPLWRNQRLARHLDQLHAFRRSLEHGARHDPEQRSIGFDRDSALAGDEARAYRFHRPPVHGPLS